MFSNASCFFSSLRISFKLGFQIALLLLFTHGSYVQSQSSLFEIHDWRLEQFIKRITYDVPAPDSRDQNLNTLTRHSGFQTNMIEDTRVVFQTFRDGNWDIYRAGGDFQAQNNLTRNAASDVRAKLTFDGQKIVFASNRDGNYEIYVMNWDGSGVTRVTNTVANDLSPSWSSDGKKIAFTSNRDGNYEVYLMNADGSNQVRVTTTTENEYGPSWSVLGTLAWATSPPNSDYGSVVVARGDGTSPNYIGVLKYLDSPVWSPDGTKLLLSGDTDNDYFNELVITDGGGRSMQTVYNPSQDYVDALANSWSPDGNSLIFTRAEYRVEGNKLVLGETRLETVSAVGGTASRLPGSSSDQSVDWRWNDTIPPTSYLQELPKLIYGIGGAEVKIAWSGIDDKSGIAAYQLLTKVPTWSDWQVSGLGSIPGVRTAYIGTGSYNESTKYDLILQTIDRAGHAVTRTASTTVYAWSLLGLIQDNRAHPLSDVSGTVKPIQLEPFQTTITGSFHTAMHQRESRVDFVKPGYTSNYHSTFGRQTNIRLNHFTYLYPTDNALVNGGFEDGLSHWNYSGLVSVANDHLRQDIQSGERSLALGNWIMTGTGAISQVVTIDSNMHRPTLSFISTSSNSFSPLSVLVDDGTNIVDVMLRTTNPITGQESSSDDSPLNWFDMQAWLGKTVTITFVISQQFTALPTYIDNVSLSSWSTPFISDISPTVLSAKSAETTLIITGVNFIPTPIVQLNDMILTNVQWLSDEKLTVSIPSNLSPGRHIVQVINPKGQASARSYAIRVGVETFLPVAFKD